METKPNKQTQSRENVLRQLEEAGIRPVQSERRISDIPFYSSVAGRKNRKVLVIQK